MSPAKAIAERRQRRPRADAVPQRVVPGTSQGRLMLHLPELNALALAERPTGFEIEQEE